MGEDVADGAGKGAKAEGRDAEEAPGDDQQLFAEQFELQFLAQEGGGGASCGQHQHGRVLQSPIAENPQILKMITLFEEAIRQEKREGRSKEPEIRSGIQNREGKRRAGSRIAGFRSVEGMRRVSDVGLPDDCFRGCERPLMNAVWRTSELKNGTVGRGLSQRRVDRWIGPLKF